MKSTVKHLSQLLAVVAVAGVCFIATPRQAQADGPNLGNVSLDAGFEIVSEYWFRGIFQENKGVIVQPYAEIGFSWPQVAESIGIDDVYTYVGSWASLHSKNTGTAGNPGHGSFYEYDFYAGIGVVIANFDVYLEYVNYMSPNNAFAGVEELILGVGYDDSELWGDFLGGGFALNPYAYIAFGIDDKAGDDTVYLELGLAPEFVLVESEEIPVTLTIPVALGLGLNNWYIDEDGDDNTFGFFSIGAIVSVPVTFIPAEYGSWTASAGLTVLFLNDAQFENGAGSNISNTRFIVSLGLGMTY
jgi:hypothetical protein